jgi:hypothetical protein
VRYWSEEEARAYLPRLRELLEALARATELALRAAGNGHGALRRAGPARPSAREVLAELEAQGIVLRDPRSGLADFPARGEDGVEYYLCWRLEDGDLAYWHLPHEGFAGRKRLPRQPRPPGEPPTPAS